MKFRSLEEIPLLFALLEGFDPLFSRRTLTLNRIDQLAQDGLQVPDDGQINGEYPAGVPGLYVDLNYFWRVGSMSRGLSFLVSLGER